MRFAANGSGVLSGIVGLNAAGGKAARQRALLVMAPQRPDQAGDCICESLPEPFNKLHLSVPTERLFRHPERIRSLF